MISLVSLITGWGVPVRLAKPLLFLIVALVTVGIIVGIVKTHDRNVIKTHDANANATVIAKTTPANDRAADQRAADAIAIAQAEQGARDVIAKAPETAPSPAAVALNCQRLRRAGKDTSRLAACAGR